ncbi:MAG TPA: hypothetical protein VF177_10845 [Anaerolineae bacterium]
MSSNPRPKLKASALKRVTPDTRFYVDYDWWEKSDLDLKTYLYTRLAVGDEINVDPGADEVDLVDPETGEVHRVDGFQYVVQTYFSQLPDDFMTRTSLVDAVFCVLLANANQPMTAREIAERVHRPTDVILKTLGGPRVYQGIRPVLDDEE